MRAREPERGRIDAVWSFTALKDARECARRWALRHGARGRPSGAGTGASPPGLALVRGRVIHAALERMLKAHAEQGGPPWGDPTLTAFWKRHVPQGIRGLVRQEVERELLRVSRHIDGRLHARLRREVDESIPAFANAVNTLLRMTLDPTRGGGAARPYAELEVEAEMAPGQRWCGRIDVALRVGEAFTLVDFKTGAPSPHDLEQLTAYACLFEQDPRTSALGSVRRLAVLYAHGSAEEREAPTGVALEAERARFARDTADVMRRVSLDPPEASPAPDRCPRCEVRARCEAYWASRGAWSDSSQPSGAIDATLTVAEVMGDGAAMTATDGGDRWFVRVAPEHASTVRGLAPGDRVRIAGAVRSVMTDEDGAPVRAVVVELGSGAAIALSR